MNSTCGDVYCWGQGREGQLGSAPDKEFVVPYPTKVVGLPPNCFSQVACGDTFTIALTNEGSVFLWGKSGDGSLHMEPVVVKGIDRAVHIAAGDRHCLAVVKHVGSGEQHVLGWRNSFHGSLANVVDASVPSRIVGICNAAMVAAGTDTSACVTLDGKVLVWGNNGKFSTLGLPPNVDIVSEPTQLFFDEPIREISLGSLYGAAVTVSGKLFTWGFGGAGNLGHGDRKNRSVPTLVEQLLAIPIKSVACTVGQACHCTLPDVRGKENPHTMVVSCDGRLFTFGMCHKGVLGNHSRKILAPSFGDELEPYCVGSPTRDNPNVSGYLRGLVCVQAISANIHAAVLTEDGNVYSFGCGSGGRMGLRRYMEGLHGGRSRMKCYVSVPSPIEAFSGTPLVALSISSGRRHMAAIVGKAKMQRVPSDTYDDGEVNVTSDERSN